MARTKQTARRPDRPQGMKPHHKLNAAGKANPPNPKPTPKGPFDIVSKQVFKDFVDFRDAGDFNSLLIATELEPPEKRKNYTDEVMATIIASFDELERVYMTGSDKTKAAK